MARTPQVWGKTKSGCIADFKAIKYFGLTNIFLLPQQKVGEYIIPPGHQVCVSPTVNHRLRDTWDERLEFNPDRYLHDNPAAGEKFAYIPFGAGEFDWMLWLGSV